jgi:hypothetical protein
MLKDTPDEAKKLGFEPGVVYPQLKAAFYGRVDVACFFTQKRKGGGRERPAVANGQRSLRAS